MRRTALNKFSVKRLAELAGKYVRSTLNARSPKRLAEDRIRYRTVKAIVRARSGGWCELQIPNVCTRFATCMHEVVKASQKKDARLDPDNILDSCIACNGWVERHPVEAQRLGLSIIEKTPITQSALAGTPFRVAIESEVA